jgi:hypothetical protein
MACRGQHGGKPFKERLWDAKAKREKEKAREKGSSQGIQADPRLPDTSDRRQSDPPERV